MDLVFVATAGDVHAVDTSAEVLPLGSYHPSLDERVIVRSGEPVQVLDDLAAYWCSIELMTVSKVFDARERVLSLVLVFEHELNLRELIAKIADVQIDVETLFLI